MTVIPASPLAPVSCCSEDKTSNVSCGGSGLHKPSLVHTCSFLFQLAALHLLQLGLTGCCSIPFTWQFLCSVWTKHIMVSYDDWLLSLCSGLNLKTTSPGRPWRCHCKHPHFNLNFVFLTLSALGSIGLARKFFRVFHSSYGFPGGSDGKESACHVGDPGLIPGLGKFPAEGKGYPLQHSCLENSMDTGAWQATVHGIAKSWTWLTHTYTHTQKSLNKRFGKLSIFLVFMFPSRV